MFPCRHCMRNRIVTQVGSQAACGLDSISSLPWFRNFANGSRVESDCHSYSVSVGDLLGALAAVEPRDHGERHVGARGDAGRRRERAVLDPARLGHPVDLVALAARRPRRTACSRWRGGRRAGPRGRGSRSRSRPTSSPRRCGARSRRNARNALVRRAAGACRGRREQDQVERRAVREAVLGERLRALERAHRARRCSATVTMRSVGADAAEHLERAVQVEQLEVRDRALRPACARRRRRRHGRTVARAARAILFGMKLWKCRARPASRGRDVLNPTDELLLRPGYARARRADPRLRRSFRARGRARPGGSPASFITHYSVEELAGAGGGRRCSRDRLGAVPRLPRALEVTARSGAAGDRGPER